MKDLNQLPVAAHVREGDHTARGGANVENRRARARRRFACKNRFHIGRIEAALTKLGKRLEITVRDAA